MKQPKLKKFALYWEAEIHGVQYVEAFDEEDAREQFDSIKHESDLPEEPIYADLVGIDEVKPRKKKK